MRWRPTAPAKLFPSLLKINNIAPDSVKIVQVGYATLYSTLLQGNANAIVAFDIDGVKVATKHPATAQGVADTVKDPEAATKALVEIRTESDPVMILG